MVIGDQEPLCNDRFANRGIVPSSFIMECAAVVAASSHDLLNIACAAAGWVMWVLSRIHGAVEGPLPVTFASWSKIKVFEVRNTWLAGTVPEIFFEQWRSLESFTIDGANIVGSLPVPWPCRNLSTYVVQNTPVSIAAWITSGPAAAQNLTQMTQFGLGKAQDTCHVITQVLHPGSSCLLVVLARHHGEVTAGAWPACCGAQQGH
jgi:hypothetical protein